MKKERLSAKCEMVLTWTSMVNNLNLPRVVNWNRNTREFGSSTQVQSQ